MRPRCPDRTTRARAAPTHPLSPRTRRPGRPRRRPRARPAPPVGRSAGPAFRPTAPEHRADELVESWLVGEPRPVPTQGWRRLVHAASQGRVNPGPGAAERRRAALLDRVRTPIPGSRRIVVLSRKGGVGKTTTSLMLGHTFATHRGDRVVALDANPDAGSLALRMRRETRFTATDLLAERAFINRYAHLRAFTSQDVHSRLEVVASDDDPRISRALGAEDYQQLIDVLDRHFNLVLVDTGTGILDDAIQGILAEADQLVVVLAPAVDGGRVAAMTLDWLDQHGHGALVCAAVAVINGVRGEGKVDVGRLRDHFRARCRAVLEIPWIPLSATAAAAGGRRAGRHAERLSRAGGRARRGFRARGPVPDAGAVVMRARGVLATRARLRRRVLVLALAVLAVLVGPSVPSANADGAREGVGRAERHTAVLRASAAAGECSRRRGAGAGGRPRALGPGGQPRLGQRRLRRVLGDRHLRAGRARRPGADHRHRRQHRPGEHAGVHGLSGHGDRLPVRRRRRRVAEPERAGPRRAAAIDREAEALARSGRPGPEVAAQAQALAGRVIDVLVGQLLGPAAGPRHARPSARRTRPRRLTESPGRPGRAETTARRG